MQISTFKIGSVFWGVDILLVKEIGHLQEVTPIPGASGFNYGLMNLRGHVVTVISPVLFMDQNVDISTDKNKLLIFKIDEQLIPLIDRGMIARISLGSDYIGLVVDAVGDVVEIEGGQKVLPPTANIPDKIKKVVSGVWQTKDQLIMMLDLPKLFSLIAQNDGEKINVC